MQNETTSFSLPSQFAKSIALLHMWLQELKQWASGNMDDSLLNHGIPKKQLLHVIKVGLFVGSSMLVSGLHYL